MITLGKLYDQSVAVQAALFSYDPQAEAWSMLGLCEKGFDDAILLVKVRHQLTQGTLPCSGLCGCWQP